MNNNIRQHVLVLGLLVAVFCGEVAGARCAPTAQGSEGQTFSATRLYYAMVNGALEKWDFYKDGSFLHQGVAAGSGTSVRHTERGTYRIQSNILELLVTKTATGFLTPGTSSRGNTTQMGGSRNDNADTRQMKLQLLGPDGENGVVLNGITFKVRHWN
jgi:hypothetical protein